MEGNRDVGSDSNWPVRAASGTAGLTQAFSGTVGPDCGKSGFPKPKPDLS